MGVFGNITSTAFTAASTPPSRIEDADANTYVDTFGERVTSVSSQGGQTVLGQGLTITPSGQAALTLDPKGTAAGDTGELCLRELAANGTDSVCLKAPDALAADVSFVLPGADGMTGQVLTTDGAGNLSFSTVSGVQDTDGDTGIYAEATPDDDDLVFITDGAERLRVQNTGEIQPQGHIIPTTDNTYDLGSATNMFRDVYIRNKLTVVGGIDPAWIQNYEVDESTVPAAAGKAALFLSDGSGGLEQGSWYSKKPDGTNALVFTSENLEGLTYLGTWDASTNTPAITNGTGDGGQYYIVSTDGTTNIDGIDSWKAGDWIIFQDETNTWQKLAASGAPTMIGADGTNPGAGGIVPQPAATDDKSYLRGDGTWSNEIQTLTPGSPTVWDGALGTKAIAAASGTLDIGPITNPVDGETYTVIVSVSGGTNANVAFDTGFFKHGGGSSLPTISMFEQGAFSFVYSADKGQAALVGEEASTANLSEGVNADGTVTFSNAYADGWFLQCSTGITTVNIDAIDPAAFNSLHHENGFQMVLTLDASADQETNFVFDTSWKDNEGQDMGTVTVPANEERWYLFNVSDTLNEQNLLGAGGGGTALVNTTLTVSGGIATPAINERTKLVADGTTADGDLVTIDNLTGASAGDTMEVYNATGFDLELFVVAANTVVGSPSTVVPNDTAFSVTVDDDGALQIVGTGAALVSDDAPHARIELVGEDMSALGGSVSVLSDIDMSVTANGISIVPFTTERFAEGGMTYSGVGSWADGNDAQQNMSGNQDRMAITVPTSGRYAYDVHVPEGTTIGDDDRPYLVVCVNGTAIWSHPSYDVDPTSSGDHDLTNARGYLDLAAGDVVQLGWAIEGGQAEVFNFRADVVNNGEGTTINGWFDLKLDSAKTVISSADTPTDDQTASGYFDIGDMRMQWGQATSDTLGTTVVTLPVAMNDTSYSISVSPDGFSSVTHAHSSKLTGQFNVQFQNNGGNAITFDWQVIGPKP